jgi:hypothetical protein
VVAGIGIVGLAQVRRPRHIPLACLPLLLGVHQLVESVVWRGADGMTSPGTAHLAVLIWAAIAFPLLPAFVPSAVLCAVWPDRAARGRVLPFCALGLASSAVLAYSLATGPVAAVPIGHVLTYSVHIPADLAVIAGYLLAAMGAPIVSGNRDLRRFGVVAALGAAVCVLTWQLAFASTWCAFAAVVSLMLIPWLRRDREGRPGERPSGPGGADPAEAMAGSDALLGPRPPIRGRGPGR